MSRTSSLVGEQRRLAELPRKRVDLRRLLYREGAAERLRRRPAQANRPMAPDDGCPGVPRSQNSLAHRALARRRVRHDGDRAAHGRGLLGENDGDLVEDGAQGGRIRRVRVHDRGGFRAPGLDRQVHGKLDARRGAFEQLSLWIDDGDVLRPHPVVRDGRRRDGDKTRLGVARADVAGRPGDEPTRLQPPQDVDDLRPEPGEPQRRPKNQRSRGLRSSSRTNGRMCSGLPSCSETRTSSSSVVFAHTSASWSSCPSKT